MAILKKKETAPTMIPTHVAIIMDGNGRWAKKRGLPRSAGHKKGANTFRGIAEYLSKIGVKYMTFYAFSTENWKRSQEEVEALMKLFKSYLEEALERQNETDMRMRFIGDRSVLHPELVALMNQIEEESKDNPGAVVNMAVNYGGREEITHACRQIAQKVKEGIINPDEISEDMVQAHLYTADQPDPDLIIRPSGELRLSNFLTWQSAYTEFWFDNVLWPDFSTEDVDRAIADYSNRQRRFGGVK